MINVVANYSNMMINDPNPEIPHSTFSQNVGGIHFGYPINQSQHVSFNPTMYYDSLVNPGKKNKIPHQIT